MKCKLVYFELKVDSSSMGSDISVRNILYQNGKKPYKIVKIRKIKIVNNNNSLTKKKLSSSSCQTSLTNNFPGFSV